MDTTPNVPKNLRELEKFLREVYTHSSDDLDFESSGHFFSKKGYGTVFLSPKETRLYRKVVADIMQAYAKDELISRRAVEKELQQALFSAFGPAGSRDDADLNQRLAKALQKLDVQVRRETTSYTVFVPLAGAGDSGLPFTFGEVRFLKFNDSQLKKFRKVARHHQVDASQINEHLKILDQLKKSNELWNRPCAIVQVKARDQEAANGLARLEIQNTIDILNFFADLTPYQHGRLSLPGDFERRLMTVMSLEDTGSFHIAPKRVGPLQPFDFNKFRNAKQLQSVVRRVNLMSKRGAVKELEDYLLKALRWAGRAALENRKEHAFILYSIALESILLPGGNTEQLGYRLRMRVAHLLEKRLEKRRELLGTVKKLYKIRSMIVHSGWCELSDEDLEEMRRICKAVFLRMLSHRTLSLMNTAKDLEDWFEDRMVL